MLASEASLPGSPFQTVRMLMALLVFVFLLMVCFLLSVALLWRLDWFPLQPCSSRGGAKGTTLHCLRHCPAPQTTAPPVVSPPLPRRKEGQRHRLCLPGARSKAAEEPAIRVNTEGYACPNRNCPYFGITDAHLHALVGDGKHGQVERIQIFRGPACRITFTARLHTPFYRLKTPSQQVSVVLSALAEGLDPSAAERVFGYRQATITSLSDSRWTTCTDLARTSLLQSPAPTYPAR